MLSFGNIPPEIPADLYRSFLVAYSATALGRMAVEAYRHVVVLGTHWYDVPAAAFTKLEHGFVAHALLSLAAAEVSNMVFGALMKIRARNEGRAQGKAEGIAEGKAEGRAEGKAQGKAEANRQWLDWLQRKTDAESRGEDFTDPPPADLSTPNT